DGAQQQTAIGFRGLVPETAPDAPRVPLLEQLAVQHRAMAGTVQWLMASRRVPPRIVPYPAAPRWRIQPDGSDACTVLAFHRDILTDVSHWYHGTLGRVLDVLDVPPGNFRTVLRNLRRADFDIDLIDTGEGMVQVLPVLVALELARRQADGGPSILAIEEPESHLHPDLQRALAEHTCAVLRQTPGARVVFETHSEHLLLAIQLQVARGELAPEDVLVYWVRQLDDGQSIADPVRFDAEARPQGHWPPDVFTGDDTLAREILRARRERQRP
ncbi:MAG TPA: AAA family ATPase, partial [Haliangium sp.]|nr:AAA family ATPase [Haliangium sp.]